MIIMHMIFVIHVARIVTGRKYTTQFILDNCSKIGCGNQGKDIISRAKNKKASSYKVLPKKDYTREISKLKMGTFCTLGLALIMRISPHNAKK